MLKYLLHRVAPLAATLAVFLVLMFGGLFWAWSQVMVTAPGANPAAMVFPGPIYFVWWSGQVNGSFGLSATTVPSGTCGGNTYYAMFVSPAAGSGNLASTTLIITASTKTFSVTNQSSASVQAFAFLICT